MLRDFRRFIARGNVIDLAVAVIVGAAFAKITTSLTDDIIMPVVGYLFGGFDLSSHFLRLGSVPPTFKGDPASYADLKAAGVAVVGWGAFLSVVVNFLILAFIIFLLVREGRRIVAEVEGKSLEEAKAEPPTELELLADIRDALRAQAGDKRT